MNNFKISLLLRHTQTNYTEEYCFNLLEKLKIDKHKRIFSKYYLDYERQTKRYAFV